MIQLHSKRFVEVQGPRAGDQDLGELGKCTPIKFDAKAVLAGFEYADTKDPTEVVIPSAGAYFIIAAPQVGFTSGGGSTAIADFWVLINGEPAADSNVRLEAKSRETKDVIVTQGIYELKAGDKVGICGAGENSFIEYIEESDEEPAIPSIIVSLFKAS